ncbi:hypothetical protein OHA04_37680 [Streptomyces sp. NBC_01590]|uniref:hypothetical protein n=1 Tax=Streptomyces sp. NBC_01590 TaxID=2975887 RepID=UPI0038637CE9
MKSNAAGEVQAETVTAYPISSGQVYQVFADASSATEPERIGLEWLDNTYTPVGAITWSLTTSSASTSWHRVGVAGPAPVGATRVRIVLSSTPSAAAVSHSWENVYLGLPIRTVGNLLSFAAESTEIDLAGWTAGTNTTIARQAPAASWAVDWYWAGGQVLAVTATAAGTASALTAESPTVTPGTEYIAYCYLSPPTTGATTWVELRYYDSAGTQLSATRSTLAAAGTGYQRQRASAPAPAGAANCRMAVGIESAAAGQVLRIEQAVIALTPVLQAGSVLPYADASFEQGLAGWTVTSGVATLARSTPWGVYAYDGAYSLTITSTTATASTIRSARFPLATGSGGLGFRLRYTGNVTAGGWTSSRGIRWYDSSGTDLGLTKFTDSGLPTPGWWLLGTDQTAPVGAAQAAIEWTFTATAVNSALRIDQVALWQALPVMEVAVQEASASVTVTVRELDAGDLIRVWRVLADGSRTLVRGPDGLLDGTTHVTSDTMVVEDYEAPLAVPISYTIELIDATTGAVETRTSPVATVPHTDINEVWLKDPANPQRNLKVVVKSHAGWSRPIEQTAYRVAGRRNTVVLSDVRGGLEGDLVVWTRSDEERAGLHWLLDPGHVLLWQAIPGMGVSDMYVTVAQATEDRTPGAATEPWREWTLPLTEVDMPTAIGVNGSAGRTWQDILSEFSTWQQVRDAFATWEDVLLNRRRE